MHRNPTLFNHRLFSLGAIIAALYSLACAILITTSSTEVLGVNAFIKPLKFGVSTVILFLFFSWFSNFVPRVKKRAFERFARVNAAVMAFELSWILIQASRGTLSHFNISTAFEGTMFSLMGIAIGISTTWTLVLFKWTFRTDFRMMPGVLWSVRFGILYFVGFGFSGYLMGAYLNHFVGTPLESAGIPFLGWSTSAGDLRIPHFFGLHALQLLPFFAHTFKIKAFGSIVLSCVYGLGCVLLMYLALHGQPPF